MQSRPGTRHDYPLGGSALEEDRLVHQAIHQAPRSRQLLEQIGIQPGWNVADLGCGPLGILHILSRFVDRARSELARRGLTNVTIVQADALETGLERGGFELVHERLLAINGPSRERLVAEMMSLLRPGGMIVLEDVDNVSWLCHPPHPAWDALLRAFHAVFQKAGGDPFVGRRLAELLRTAGAQDVEVETRVEVAIAGTYQRTHLLSLVDSVADRILASGLMASDEFAAHKTALARHLEDPNTVVIDKLLVQAWGRNNV